MLGAEQEYKEENTANGGDVKDKETLSRRGARPAMKR